MNREMIFVTLTGGMPALTDTPPNLAGMLYPFPGWLCSTTSNGVRAASESAIFCSLP